MLLLFFITGACLGSFLNVVIYRLPRMMLQETQTPVDYPQPVFNLLLPRSHCPVCGETLGGLQLIPMVSWLVQRGRCHHCHNGIAGRYPLTELGTGVLFAVTLICWRDPATALVLSLFLSVLLTLALIDLQHLLLPDVLTLPLMWGGLLWSLLPDSLVSPESAVLGAVAGYLSLWSVYWLYRLLRHQEGLGYGDFKLMAALGAWLGAGSINMILLLGALAGCIGWCVSRRVRTTAVMPFGPALIMAAVLWLFSHSPLIQEGVLATFLNWRAGWAAGVMS